MHRRFLLRLLDAYVARWPADGARAARVRRFVERHPDCLLRTCLAGHVTASAWIVSADGRSVLLGHHRKLGRWLQLGGHVDGEPDPFRAALREAEEESGIGGFATLPGGEPPLPLDVDVHAIPARGAEPAHLHHDVRYLLIAPPGAEARASAESTALRWFARDRLAAVARERSLRRMDRRARRLLAAAGLG
jgi:8-oxo-dGTP pyrophosphatase MutT (NUDIX family)